MDTFKLYDPRVCYLLAASDRDGNEACGNDRL